MIKNIISSMLTHNSAWSYSDKKKSGRTKCGAENHYNCMSIEDIKNLPIKDISEDNAVLFLWVVFPLLKEGLEVIESWGFKYKTIGFNWIKTNKDNSVWHGVGAYTKCVDGDSVITIMNKENNIISRIPIKQLLELDITNYKIHSHTGWKDIYNVKKNKIIDPIKFKTIIGDLFVSRNHKLFYKGVFKPRIKNTNKRDVQYVIKCDESEKIKKLWTSYNKSYGLLFSNTIIESKNNIEKIEEIELIDDLAWLIGLFVAVGNFGKTKQDENNQIRFSLQSKEIYYAERIIKIISGLNLVRDRYKNSKITPNIFHKEKKGISVYFNSIKIKKIIDTITYGIGSHGKRLNLDVLLNTSKSFRESFLEGVFNGAGYIPNKEYYRITLCNKKLIEDLKIIYHSLGIPTTILEGVATCNKNNSTKFKTYTLSKLDVKMQMQYEENNVDSIGIYDCENISGEYEFYDISVEDEVFIVDDLISHNSNSEICLFATKGNVGRLMKDAEGIVINTNPKDKISVISNYISSIVLAQRQDHSRKPTIIKDKIVELFGDISRIELFSRTKTFGWSSWGNEVTSDISLS